MERRTRRKNRDPIQSKSSFSAGFKEGSRFSTLATSEQYSEQIYSNMDKEQDSRRRKGKAIMDSDLSDKSLKTKNLNVQKDRLFLQGWVAKNNPLAGNNLSRPRMNFNTVGSPKPTSKRKVIG